MDNLNHFIKEMTRVVETNKKDADRVNEAERLVSELIQDLTWLSAEKCKADQNHYARHSLYHDPHDRFEIIALVWLPGQCTPIHDHDGTWGVEGVVSGRMKITNYLQMGTVSEDVVKLRYSGSLTVNEQSTGQLLPPADCHVLEAEGKEKVVTLHVYGKQLNKFKIFKPLKDEETYQALDHWVHCTGD